MLIAFLYAVNRMTVQVQIIVDLRNILKGAEPALRQVYSLKNEADEFKEPEGIEKIDTFKEIKFSDVSFLYNGNEKLHS